MEHKVAKMNDIDRLAVSDTCIMMIHEKFGAGAVLNIIVQNLRSTYIERAVQQHRGTFKDPEHV